MKSCAGDPKSVLRAPDVEEIRACRSCGANHLTDILDLGSQPLANALVKSKDQAVNKFPLSIAFCPSCSLVQLKETILKEILFDSYVWVTGTSTAAKEYAKLFFERVVKNTGIKKDDFVVEIASNDGTILKQFVASGYQVLGVEPARNIADIAQAAGVRTLNAYWNKATAQRVLQEYGKPRVVMARNVIPHVSQLHEVIEGISYALGHEGIGVIEFHDGSVILRELHYDSIYHEHLCYFTIKSMTKLLNQYSLHPFHIDPSPISGGSQVIYFSKKQQPCDETYTSALNREEAAGANTAAAWLEFGKQSYAHKNATLELMSSFKNKTVVGFGASARSSTYLNFCGLGSSQIKGIIDNNPLKQGLYTAGSNIPIIPKAQGLALKPDVIFILAWNFKNEIIQECRAAGFKGEFLVPFPKAPQITKAL